MEYNTIHCGDNNVLIKQLDPFMGSGTVAKMAENTGRNYIGFECSQEYIDIAKIRLQQRTFIY